MRHLPSIYSSLSLCRNMAGLSLRARLYVLVSLITTLLAIAHLTHLLLPGAPPSVTYGAGVIAVLVHVKFLLTSLGF